MNINLKKWCKDHSLLIGGVLGAAGIAGAYFVGKYVGEQELGGKWLVHDKKLVDMCKVVGINSTVQMMNDIDPKNGQRIIEHCEKLGYDPDVRYFYEDPDIHKFLDGLSHGIIYHIS